MAEENLTTTETETTEPAPAPAPLIPETPLPPVESRFLFVDIAALRAKQLRRGALPRLRPPAEGVPTVIPHKPERVAMEEVRQGMVFYEVPDEAEKS